MKTQMPAEVVIEFYTQMQKQGATIWIDGGWGVDALLGKQTREHKDLDIALEIKDLKVTCDYLEKHGYREVERDNDWNFVLENKLSHRIDFHIFVFDNENKIIDGLKYPEDSLTGEGIINGCKVKCIEPQHMVNFHTGYKLKDTDYHDVKALCEKFGLNYPEGYSFLKDRES